MRLLFFLLLLSACKARTPEQEIATNIEDVIKNTVVDTAKVYALHLSPADGTVYRYTTTNETTTLIEMENNKVETVNNTEVKNLYTISKDSNDHIVFTVRYDNIKVATKKGDKETELNAETAGLTNNPVERMLNALKDQTITVTVSSNGAVKSINGYEELGYRFLSGFSDNDSYGREIARQQWDQIIINGIVKGNIGQMFKTLPDTSVYLGFRWMVSEKQEGELPMDIETIFLIKEINDDGKIVVASESKMKSAEGAITNIPGQKDVSATLTGKRTGIAYVNGNSGMVERSHYTTKISGFVQVMGIKTPMTLIRKLDIKGAQVIK
ncbi:MAG: hypothetical protein KF746_11915 [Chitinophagaceae bacterium]|nr:hypothetical protein [Chitinophagaceae bacterium]